MHEADSWDANCFLTLTLRDLPPGGSLDVEHWKGFAKRLRARGYKFRYFHCGEYGERTRRPHYHAAIFGQDFTGDRKYYAPSKSGFPLWTSATLDDAWRLGQVWIGNLTFESAAYVARYVTKKITGRNALKHYNGRKPEYTTMSRDPGLGKAWISKYLDEVYRSDEVIVNGAPSQPPKYYDQVLGALDPDRLERVKAARLESAKVHEWNRTAARLAVREEVQIARMGAHIRDFDQW